MTREEAIEKAICGSVEMNTEEAVKEIEFIERKFISLDIEQRQALKMARKALEQEPILDKIRAEIEASRWTNKDIRIERNALASGLDKALEIIDKYRKEN